MSRYHLEAGIASIEHHASLAKYHLLPATQGCLYEELGDTSRAANFYQRALECPCGTRREALPGKMLSQVGQALSPAN